MKNQSGTEVMICSLKLTYCLEVDATISLGHKRVLKTNINMGFHWATKSDVFSQPVIFSTKETTEENKCD